MRLQRLKLRNFKGCRSFDLVLDGDNASVYGDNGTFKTTLFDAFLWLLFNKDSSNRSDFAIKTLGHDGNVIHGLDHEVGATLRLNGKEVVLRKVYREKWTKKRGSATKEFTGHTTDYFIDGVPAKKGEYDKLIADIASEDIFKLLTSPSYFNEQLHWQERRNILLEVCGDISDEDVIAADKKLSKLSEILSNRSLDDHRKVIQARRSEINKELEKIPVRIDETQRSLPDVSAVDTEKLLNKIKDRKRFISSLNQEILRIESGGEIAEKTKALREIEADILDIKNEHRQKNEGEAMGKRAALSRLKDQIATLQHEVKFKEREIKNNETAINDMETKIQRLREEWHQIDAQQFGFKQNDTCPTCGQELPEEQLAEAREKALARFNREKAKKLEDITVNGKTASKTMEVLRQQNSDMEAQIKGTMLYVDELKEKERKIQAQIDALNQQVTDISENQEYVRKLKEKERLEAAIANLKDGSRQEINEIRNEIAGLEEENQSAEKSIAAVEQYRRGQERINELQQQERDLAAEYERLEQELFLTEEFIRRKVSLLEEKINSKFRLARFKLFNVLVNGAVEETCETLYNGVPYSSGLNDGHRGIVGLDIIDTFADYYGFHPPIFYDNAESVTQLPEMKSQMICLYVSEPDKELRVETQKELAKEAV